MTDKVDKNQKRAERRQKLDAFLQFARDLKAGRITLARTDGKPLAATDITDGVATAAAFVRLSRAGGRKGGKASSPRKTEAVRANAKLPRRRRNKEETE